MECKKSKNLAYICIPGKWNVRKVKTMTKESVNNSVR